MSQVKIVKVNRVIDGDTFTFVEYGVEMHARLREGDAPERGQYGYTAAKRKLAGWIAGQVIRIMVHARDHYGRLIVTILV